MRLTHLVVFFLPILIYSQPLDLDKNGFIKELRTERLKAAQIELLGRFHEVKYANGRRYVALARKNKKWGVADSNLSAILPFKFNNLNFLNSYVVRSYSTTNKYFRIGLNKVDTLNFSEITSFSDGYAKAAIGDKFCVIDSTGAVVFYFEEAFLQDNQTAAGHYSFNNESAREAEDRRRTATLVNIGSLTPVGPNLFIILKKEKYYLFHRSGKEIIIPGAESFSAGFHKDHIVCHNKDFKYGLINLEGKLVLPIQYDYMSDDDGILRKTTNKFMRIQKAGFFGLTDKNGKLKIPCVMQSVAFTSSKNHFAVKKGTLNFIYDTTWKPVSMPPGVKNVISVWERKQGLAYLTSAKNKFLVSDEKGIRKTDSLTYAYMVSDSLFMLNNNQINYYIVGSSLKPLHEEPSRGIYYYPSESAATLLVFTMQDKIIIKTAQGRTINTYTYPYLELILKENEFVMKQNDMTGLVDSLNNVLIPFKYTSINRKANILEAIGINSRSIYDLNYKKIESLDSVEYVNYFPGNISLCLGKLNSNSGILLDDKLIFTSHGKINSFEDGLFHLDENFYTYTIDCYGNKF